VLITGKTIATGTNFVFKTLEDHQVQTVDKSLTFLATGNGVSGINIILTMRRG